MLLNPSPCQISPPHNMMPFDSTGGELIALPVFAFWEEGLSEGF
jgi:hypothetical protein